MKPYGKCPVCKRWIRITNLEKLFNHSDGKKAWPPANCPGWGQDPEEIEYNLTPQEAQYLEKLVRGPHVKLERPKRKE